MKSEIIGGVGLTHLTVYEQRRAPDGEFSGSPHVHALTDEAYYVIGGRGRAELHDVEHGFRTVTLKPGDYMQFPPCVIHRIVSTGGLVILAVMGNAGLAENGDARIYFGKAVDDDSDEYARLAGLAKNGLTGALDRRDAAVRAYGMLITMWESNREGYFAELKRFVDKHLNGAMKYEAKFSQAITEGPFAWGKRSISRLSALPKGEADLEGEFHRPGPDYSYGMCGILRPIMGLKPIAEVCG